MNFDSIVAVNVDKDFRPLPMIHHSTRLDWQPLEDRVIGRRIEDPLCIFRPKHKRLIVLTDGPPARYFKVEAVGPKVEEVRPNDIVALPGVAAVEPDKELDRETIIFREGDIGFIVRN